MLPFLHKDLHDTRGCDEYKALGQLQFESEEHCTEPRLTHRRSCTPRRRRLIPAPSYQRHPSRLRDLHLPHILLTRVEQVQPLAASLGARGRLSRHDVDERELLA